MVKISQKQFFAILRENAGLFARTAKAIKKEYNVEYSRQAVRTRALKKPELLQDIYEENIDIAEEGLHSLMRNKNPNIRMRSIEMFLKTKGKSRGYVERTEVDATITGKVDIQPKEWVKKKPAKKK